MKPGERDGLLMELGKAAGGLETATHALKVAAEAWQDDRPELARALRMTARVAASAEELVEGVGRSLAHGTRGVS